jgi:undecaprenyl-diphosphatase
MHFFSEATSYKWFRIFLILLALALIAANPKTRRTTVQALIVFPLSDGTTNLCKHFWPELRPYQELPDVVLHTLGTHPVFGTGAHDAANFGTVSAHSANMAAVAFVFCYHLKWWGSPWVVIAFITGLSRIYLAAHYPYQVLLGWLTGMAIAFAVCKTWDLANAARLRSSRTKEETIETA